ncbi:glycosyltransferase [Aerococcus urinaeequi]|uniref:glycosyltransferase n=1 Tax=Aerococcus urinaeequi TaxID=51665 RepID=UPI003D6C0547
MKILVINSAASEGGALSILKDFVSYIEKNDKENDWVFLLSDYYIEESNNIKIMVLPKLKSNLYRLGFESIFGKNFINQKISPDIVFSMQNTTIRFLNVPQVLYLHQAIPFQKEKKFSLLKKDEFKFAIKQFFVGFIIKRGLKRASRIIVQTNWMKNIIASEIKSKELIEVIPPSIDVKLEDNQEEYKYNSFFYPTSELLYKNIAIIEKAEVLLAKKDLNYRIEITTNKDNKSNINFIGKVSRNIVLNKLYSSVLIFPSYIESYGLPLAEAKFLNSVILSADTPFAREVLEGYENAYFFHKDNEEELASLMEKSIKGKLARNIKINNSRVKEKNSWELVRNSILREYKN